MPTLQSVEQFVGMVEAGQTVEAIGHFYADHATVQENAMPPRVGKSVLLQHEQAAKAAVTDLRATCVRPVLVAGDVVVIRWIFSYTTKRGKPVQFEELAYQRWEGELIAGEQFFYDPAQLTASVTHT